LTAPADKYPPITITAYAYLFGAGFVGISLLGCTDADGRWEIPASAWWALAYAVLLSSVLCSGIITWANKRTTATYVTAFYPLQVRPLARGTDLDQEAPAHRGWRTPARAGIPAGQPFVSAVCSALFLAKHINLGEILGGVLIIIGLLSVVASRVRPRRGRCPGLARPSLNPNGRVVRVAASPL